MKPLWRTLGRIIVDLSAADVSFALVGGLAASSWTEPRFTRDVELAVAVSDDARAEALVHRLLAGGYRATTVVEQEATGRLATVRLVSPIDASAIVDLLFASCGIEAEIVASAEDTAIASKLTVPVAQIGHLIAMKLLSESPQRPQDRVDLVRLVQESDESDRAVAAEAVALIEARGFARDRDLAASLAELVRGLG